VSFSEVGWVLEEVVEWECEEAGGCGGADEEGDNLVDDL
jgi:hypothetical protein